MLPDPPMEMTVRFPDGRPVDKRWIKSEWSKPTNTDAIVAQFYPKDFS
tara:strand:- start:12 stop:155 length:144 start_codon:yes stop_codon:yes gene_type:complete